LVESHSARRKVLAVLALVVVLISAFIILRPRLWVKNKTAKVIVDGRLSEDVKLYHGSDDRLLFYLKDDPQGAYVYDARTGLWRCDKSYFFSAKIIVLTARSRSSGCAEDENGDVMGSGTRNSQSLQFRRQDRDIIVSWQAAPR
jgi:hypothetical protein